MPVNNRGILNKIDLEPYQSHNCTFNIIYPQTPLIELNTEEDIKQVTPEVLRSINMAASEGAAAIIIYAFGDVAIQEASQFLQVPIFGLGKLAIHIASIICRNAFTVLPAQLDHNGFIEAMIKEENLERKFNLATNSVTANPSQIRENVESVLRKLIAIADIEIAKGIDTFTLGCGSFIGITKPLETKLRQMHPNKAIKVVDPISTALKIAEGFAISQ